MAELVPKNGDENIIESRIGSYLSPVSLWEPDFDVASAWLEHAPFGFWITNITRPRSFVELGTHCGYSYFAFCQAVKRLGLESRCVAVDTWEGDEHAGFYGEEIYDNVRTYNDANYAGFSRLLRLTFDQALVEFGDATIDLLHIDGRHFYEDVKHDFESWRRKLSERAVVLFHDTNEHARDFGVFRFWEEIEQEFPSFNFLHGHGLGVLGYGQALPVEVREFFRAVAEPSVANEVRRSYASLGQRASAATKVELKKLQARLAKRETEIHGLSTTSTGQEIIVRELKDRCAAETARADKFEAALKLHEHSINELKGVVAAREKRIKRLQSSLTKARSSRKRAWTEVSALGRSTSWRVTWPLRAVSTMVKRVLRKAHSESGTRSPISGRFGWLGEGSSRTSTFDRYLKFITRQGCPAEVKRSLEATQQAIGNILRKLETCPEKPLVSVVMPTHNRAPIIKDAINSVIEQDYLNWELLICDDGSTDNTAEVVKGLKNAKIRHLKLKKRGAAAARNAGLKQSAGSIIAYLDSDNIWHPSFLSAAVSALLDNPGKFAAYCEYLDFNIDQQSQVTIDPTVHRPFDHQQLVRKNFIDLNSFVHRKELYGCFGGFIQRLKRRQDYGLILKYTWLQDPIHLPLLLCAYQRNENLVQITTAHRHDQVSASIIRKAKSQYFRCGLPLTEASVGPKPTIVTGEPGGVDYTRASALAEAISEKFTVQLISFAPSTATECEGVQSMKTPLESKVLPQSDFPQFFHSMAKALAAVRGDVIYAVEPRLPSFGLALLASFHHRVPIILEWNGLAHAMDAGNEAYSLGRIPNARELLDPAGRAWSDFLVSLAMRVPVITSRQSSGGHGLGKRCLQLDNAQDARVCDPSLYDRERIRGDLGLSPVERLIVFDGKIEDCISSAKSLDNPRYRFLWLDSGRAESRSASMIALPIGLVDRKDFSLVEICHAADVVIVWNSVTDADQSEIGQTMITAFAMRAPVIANESGEVRTLSRQGYLHIVPFGEYDALAHALEQLFTGVETAEIMREAGQRLFRRRFSRAAASGNFALALARARATQERMLPIADEFARVFDAFYRATGEADTRGFASVDRATLPIPEDLNLSTPQSNRPNGIRDFL